MARWITIVAAAVPFDYRFPDRSALLAFTRAGEYFVKDEVADYAVGRGFAIEGKASESTARSTKGRTRRRRSAKAGGDAPASNSRANTRVARKGVADHGGTNAGPAVGASAG